MINNKQLLVVLIGLGLQFACCGCRPVHPVPVAGNIAPPSPTPIGQSAAPSRPADSSPSGPVTMRVAPTVPADTEASVPPALGVLLAAIQDAYFDYNRHDLRADAVSALEKNVAALRSILRGLPNLSITIEGHCDERGSAEYNLGLGDQRARTAREFLIALGIPGSQLRAISFGKERPQCVESNDACWQKNRRAHLAANH